MANTAARRALTRAIASTIVHELGSLAQEAIAMAKEISDGTYEVTDEDLRAAMTNVDAAKELLPVKSPKQAASFYNKERGKRFYLEGEDHPKTARKYSNEVIRYFKYLVEERGWTVVSAARECGINESSMYNVRQSQTYKNAQPSQRKAHV
jgi:hypothetical protein